MTLRPCPSCSRHVRVSEAACPFCSSALSLAPVAAPLVMPTQRLGRAALATFGAMAIASAPGCGTATTIEDAGHDAYYGAVVDAYGVPDVGPPMLDAGTDSSLVAAYGGPPVDSGASVDANQPDVWGAALYGAPPPPPAPDSH